MPAFMKTFGRPPDLSEELTKKICDAIRIGAYPETACVVNGVSKDVFYLWCKIANGKVKKEIRSGPRKGERVDYTEKEKEPYKHFLNSVQVAIEEANMRDLIVIERAANPPQHAVMLKNEKGEQLHDKDGVPMWIDPLKPDWSAARWRLSKRNPKLYGDKTDERPEKDDEEKEISSKSVESEEQRLKRVEGKLARFREIIQ